MDTINILDKLDDYSRTLKGITALLDDMQSADGDGVHTYSHLRFHLLGRIVFDVVQNMDKLYEEINKNR
ncbi:hypothetical protein MNB_SM-5-594 [hydrothermal vent metagenome]|uniref:Uncharacterized protein n=1 Tax=hydrothermal vent metagenome TaxID=652676 RepID=A0A1W1CLJ9_9ZZZZ